MNVEKRAIAAPCAELILDAYRSYCDHYRAITRRARDPFVHSDWVAAQKDTLERLDLYPRIVANTVSDVKARLGQLLGDETVMVEIKQRYALLAGTRLDRELAATFFNSVVRRVQHTIGVNLCLEFNAEDFDPPLIEVRGAGGKAFLLIDKTLNDIPARAAILFRPRGCDPSLLMQDGLPFHG